MAWHTWRSEDNWRESVTRVLEMNLGCQALQQTPLTTELSHWPGIIDFKISRVIFLTLTLKSLLVPTSHKLIDPVRSTHCRCDVLILI